MAYVISAITAPDGYTSTSTIQGGRFKTIAIDVVNSSIYWQLQLAVGSSGQGVWQENAETPMTPGSRVITSDGEITGIRVRAAIPAAQISPGNNQAVVTVRAE